MNDALIQQKNYENEQKQFAHNQHINDILNEKLRDAENIDPDKEILTLRCQGSVCKKVLGKVNGKGYLITESKRSGSWIKTIMIEGFVECKKCDNILYWNARKLNRREK